MHINDGPLSPRELEVATLFANGHPYKEVATTLNISYATVHSHAESIRTKTRARNLTHAVAILSKEGILMTAQEAAYRQKINSNRQGPPHDDLYWKWRRVLESIGELPLSPIERQVMEQTLHAALTRLQQS